MKIDFKSLIKIAVAAFLLYLGIYYFPGISKFAAAALGATSPLIFGCIIAYILNLPMKFYEKNFFPNSKRKWINKLRRPLCMTASVITLLAVIGLVIGLILPQLISCVSLIISEISLAIDLLIPYINDLEILPENIVSYITNIDWASKINQIMGILTTGIGSVMDIVIATVTSVFNGIVSGLLSIIFALYLLAGKDRILSQIKRVMKRYLPDKANNTIAYVASEMHDCFSRYITGQCTEALILGFLCLVGMMILRLPYYTMVSALIAFTALIPVAGAYIGAGIGAFIIIFESPAKALVFIIFIIILQQLEGNLIFPRVVGSSMGLPGIWVLAAVTIGGGIMGVFGMLLGVPLAATAYRLLKKDVNKGIVGKDIEVNS